jgi:hypothetical protein
MNENGFIRWLGSDCARISDVVKPHQPLDFPFFVGLTQMKAFVCAALSYVHKIVVRSFYGKSGLNALKSKSRGNGGATAY